MARDPGPVHTNLRRLIDASAGIVATIPDAKPLGGSVRAAERSKLVRTQGGGGRERANLHDRLNRDLMPFLANIGILVSGVADLFEAGVDPDGRGLNTPALTVLIRAPLEAAGQVTWLLDATISPNERVRRYITWFLADLVSQRMTVDGVGNAPDELMEKLDAKEALALDWIRNAKWTAQPRTTSKRGNPVPPALLDTTGPQPRPVQVPSKTELVNRLVGSDIAYSMLSISAHGDRWAITETMTVTDMTAKDGRKLARVTGFGVSANMLKSAAQAAIVLPTVALARWNGVDTSAMNEPIQRLGAVNFSDAPNG